MGGTQNLFGSLLRTQDGHEQGLALDRLLHSHFLSTPRVAFSDRVSTSTIKVDSLQFSDCDLSVLGTLDHGQFRVMGECPLCGTT